MAGVLLLLATGAYYGYGFVARSGMNNLAYSADRPSQISLNLQAPRTRPLPQNGAAHESSDTLGETDTITIVPRMDASPHNVASMTVSGMSEPTAAENIELQAQDRHDPGTSVTRQIATTAVIESSYDTYAVESKSDSQRTVEPLIIRVTAEIIHVHNRYERRIQTDQDQSDYSAIESQSAEQSHGYALGSLAQSIVDTGDQRPSPGVGPDIGDEPKPAMGTSPVSPNSSGHDELKNPVVALNPIDLSRAEATTYSRPHALHSYDRSEARRIRIPAIGVDSAVEDLKVVFLGDSAAWATPDKIVGHIPTTARPGSEGQGWYFGHLESPVRGEGNVFRRLPEIPVLAKDNPVYVFLETDSHDYVYRVYNTEVVTQQDLRVSNSNQRDITLVACIPRFYYDHRLLVTASLVGVKRNQPDPD